MKKAFSLVVVLGCLFSLSLEAKITEVPLKMRKPILDTLKVNGSEVAIITMDNGNKIYMKFFPEDAPKTVKNFIMLANLGFYDSLNFHRVVPNFVAQGGDPAGDGTGGAGYNIVAEFNSRKHLTGTVAMARANDPNSASSQFYICLNPLPSLDNQYTVFGQVIKGMDVVKQIKQGDMMKSVTIQRPTYQELQVTCKGEGAIYTPPVIKGITFPDYPIDENGSYESGNINLKILVDKKGAVQNVKFLRSSLKYTETKLKPIIMTWAFQPAAIEGEAVSDWVNLPLQFKVTGKQCEVRCGEERKDVNLQ